MKPITAVLLVAVGTQACAPLPVRQDGTAGRPVAAIDPCLDQSAQQVGTVLGAVIGGVLAKQVSDAKYAVPVGILLGGALGNAVGKDISRRNCELSKIAKKHALEMHTLVLQLPSTSGSTGQNAPVGMSAGVIDRGGAGGQFLAGSDVLTPSARAYFTEIASTYRPQTRRQGMGGQEAAALDHTKILVIGHTDDQEDSRVAADLSERRARAVADVFRAAGVPEQSIYFQGAGETLPVGDNNTEAGRAVNRRVEIVDVANDSVMASYLASRVSTSSYFRPTSETRLTAPAQAAVGSPSATNNVAAKDRKSGASGMAPPRGDMVVKAAKDRSGAADLAQSSGRSARPGSDTADSRASPRAAAAVTPGQENRRPSATRTVAAAGTDQPVPGLNMGGSRFNPDSHQIRVGEPLHSRGFSLVSVAHASEAPLQACVEDRPRIAHSVKSLSTGKAYRIGDYQPGAFGTSWSGKVNGHLVSLTNVAVIRAGGLPANDPNVLIFKNFSEKGGVSRRPDFAVVPTVNTYAGTRGTLYRVFFEKGAPIRCIDVLLPPSGPFRAEQGFVYQDRDRQTFASEFRPEIVASTR